MKSGVERTFDALLVAGSTLYSITALYCVYAMWTLRKQFSIAIRSPLLGCWIGATLTLRSWAGGSYLLISVDWDPESELDLSGASAVFRIIFSPASLICVGAIIAWVVRLLVMYDPIKRRKWGRYTNEKRTFRVLVWTFVLLEAGAWASAGVNGLIWTGTNLAILDLAGTLATLAAAVLLSGKLRKVHDIGRLSSDIQRIGALMVGVIFSFVALLFLPLPPLLFKYTAISLTIFPLCVVWITNIKPIRDYLRQHDRGSQAGLPVLLWRRITSGHTPSHGSLGRVACTTDDQKRATFHGLGSTSNPHLHETALAAVMEFLPLQQAFGEYCRKALCSESFQFLVDVSGFQNVVAGAHAAGGESSTDFDEFTVIVTEYIKDGSNSEINIDCATKKKILELCERSAFTSLDVDDRENIFLAAEREIAKMLAENLLNKFRTTPEYKELAGDMVFETT